jgi:hypothetical protein
MLKAFSPFGHPLNRRQRPNTFDFLYQDMRGNNALSFHLFFLLNTAVKEYFFVEQDTEYSPEASKRHRNGTIAQLPCDNLPHRWMGHCRMPHPIQWIMLAVSYSENHYRTAENWLQGIKPFDPIQRISILSRSSASTSDPE